MSDATSELMSYMRQERSNSRAMVRPVTPEAQRLALCAATGLGHYWIVDPPPIQTHQCKDCCLVKEYIRQSI